MVDRYTLTLLPDELALVLGVNISQEYLPQYNAAPTKSLPIIVAQKSDQLTFQKWGLMAVLSKNRTMSPKFFNLPINSVLNKSSYKKKLGTHRCVIPMDGFYIWKKVAKKQQIPYYFFYPDKRVFCVAGLWEETEEGNSFIMITGPANNSVDEFQEDMPLIMDVGSTKKWLETVDIDELETLLSKKSNDDLISHTVSPNIKDIDANDPSFTSPAPASDQHGNYTLFS